MLDNQYLRIHSTLAPVNGYLRSVMHDFVREKYFFISNRMYDFIKIYDGKALDDMKVAEQELLSNVLNQHWGILLTKDELDFFPNMSFDYRSPCKINNTVILYNGNIILFRELVRILASKNIQCKYVAVVIEKTLNEDQFISLFDELKSNEWLTFELFVKFYPSYTDSFFEQHIFKNKKAFVFFESEKEELNSCFMHTSKPLDFNFVGHQYFAPNLQCFSEAQHYNLYYHDKLVINETGKAIMSLTNRKEVGVVNIASVESVLDEINTLNFSSVTKDSIDICSDCEFRYMCVDSCEIKMRKDKSFYRAKECNYNPYISKWSHEKEYLELKECGITCNEDGLIIDISILDSIIDRLYT